MPPIIACHTSVSRLWVRLTTSIWNWISSPTSLTHNSTSMSQSPMAFLSGPFHRSVARAPETFASLNA